MREKREKRVLLSHGLFEKHFMDSKVTTRSVTMKELVLGHVVGPLGLIMLINTIASLLEIYIMKQMSLAVGGDVTGEAYKSLGTLYYWMAMGTRILAMPMGLVTGYLMQHTKSRQGRMRPWYLIFGFVAIFTGMLMFLKPAPSSEGMFWVYFYLTYVIYNLPDFPQHRRPGEGGLCQEAELDADIRHPDRHGHQQRAAPLCDPAGRDAELFLDLDLRHNGACGSAPAD